MSKPVDELKKIVKEKELDLNDFESVFDAITEIEEVKQKLDKEKKQLNAELKETKEQKEQLEKDNEALKNENKETKDKITDLKIKYIERFENNDGKGNPTDNSPENNAGIKIKDLFKEE